MSVMCESEVIRVVLKVTCWTINISISATLSAGPIRSLKLPSVLLSVLKTCSFSPPFVLEIAAAVLCSAVSSLCADFTFSPARGGQARWRGPGTGECALAGAPELALGLPGGTGSLSSGPGAESNRVTGDGRRGVQRPPPLLRDLEKMVLTHPDPHGLVCGGSTEGQTTSQTCSLAGS